MFKEKIINMTNFILYKTSDNKVSSCGRFSAQLGQDGFAFGRHGRVVAARGLPGWRGNFVGDAVIERHKVEFIHFAHQAQQSQA